MMPVKYPEKRKAAFDLFRQKRLNFFELAVLKPMAILHRYAFRAASIAAFTFSLEGTPSISFSPSR